MIPQNGKKNESRIDCAEQRTATLYSESRRTLTLWTTCMYNHHNNYYKIKKWPITENHKTNTISLKLDVNLPWRIYLSFKANGSAHSWQELFNVLGEKEKPSCNQETFQSKLPKVFSEERNLNLQNFSNLLSLILNKYLITFIPDKDICWMYSKHSFSKTKYHVPFLSCKKYKT